MLIGGATAGAEGTVYEGKTCAELGAMVREAQEAGDEALAEELQTRRNLVMNASFLRASRFTSVVSSGLSALVMGLGVVLGFIGAAPLKIAPTKVAVTAWPSESQQAPALFLHLCAVSRSGAVA